MSTPENNQPVQETMIADGSELMPEEQALIAQGLDENRDEAAEAAEAARVEAERVAAEAEAKAKEEADAAAAEHQRQQAAAAAAQGQPAPAAVIPDAVAKPDAPRDFEQEFASLDEKLTTAQGQFDRGEIEAEELARINRETNAQIRTNMRDEARYEASLASWEAGEQARTQAIENAQVASQQSWSDAALAWEKDNAEFMSNPLRAKGMQDTIELVAEQARKEGRHLTDAQLLHEAGQKAMEAYGFKATPGPNPSEKIREAIATRTADKPGSTLGDVPAAGREPIRGNEAYAQLDGLGIEDLESATANMSQAEVERFLRDAPGANAHGRD